MDSRGASNKTRIETIYANSPSNLDKYIQEAHPIKQGLKLYFGIIIICCDINSRGASNKTRIETFPLGLTPKEPFIQEAHPIKQGLKQNNWILSSERICYSRGASNKTRIET